MDLWYLFVAINSFFQFSLVKALILSCKVVNQALPISICVEYQPIPTISLNLMDYYQNNRYLTTKQLKLNISFNILS